MYIIGKIIITYYFIIIIIGITGAYIQCQTKYSQFAKPEKTASHFEENPNAWKIFDIIITNME